MDSSFLTDENADKIGAAIAMLFNVKRDTEHPNRYQTEVGTKTCQGIARTVFHIFLEVYQQQQAGELTDLADKLRSLQNGGGALPEWARTLAISELERAIAQREEEIDKQNKARD